MPETKGAPVLAASPVAPEAVPVVHAAADAEVAPVAVPVVAAGLLADSQPRGAAAEHTLVTGRAAVAALATVDVDVDADVDIDVEAEPQPEVEEGPVHRPLIRAQLPRVEGHKEERRLPEFTIRQATRGGNAHFRGGDTRMKPSRPGGHAGNGGNATGHGNAGRPHGAPRFAGSRPDAPGRGQQGRGGPPAAGFRAGQPRPGGGRKRSR